MNVPTDQQLLADYARSGSEAAFAELVRRYVDLVHSTAWRLTGETHSAQDVTQAVFMALAQDAARLAGHPVLSGWLHTTARNLAAKHVRAAVRRQDREQEAVAMNELLSTPDASWLEIAPQLDAALGELTEADRDAVLLRYFEKKSAAEMAEILGLTDDAAQKRVSRAVEKLREFFSDKKITIGAGSLGILISANAVQSAPVGLVAVISTAALAGTAATTSTIIAATTKTIVMTTLQKIVVGATVAVLAGAGIFEARQASQLRNQLQALQQGQTGLTNQIATLEAANTRLSNQVAQSQDQKALTQAQMNELLKLRGQKGQTQTTLSELAKMRVQGQTATGLSPFMTNAMRMGLSFAQKAQEKRAQEKLGRMKDLLHLTDTQAQAVQDIMQRHIDQNNQNALATISGQKPVIDPNAPTEDAEIKALLTPDQLAAWPDFQQAQTQADAQDLAKADVTLVQNSVDLTPDQQSQAQAALYQYELDQKNNPTNAMATMAMVTQARAKGDLASAEAMAMDMMKQQLSDKLNLLDGILTPDQLKTYQQSQQDMLDIQASTFKIFLPGTNNTAATQ